MPELDALYRLIDEGAPDLQPQVLCQVDAGSQRFEVIALTLGNPSPEVPAMGYFGGVHGLERIGTEVVLTYLATLVQRLKWDQLLHRQLESLRLVFMPLVNPGGLWQGTRANPNGVDLMRNAPVHATEPVPFLIGGQRLSAILPWYRGPLHAGLQPEAQALCDVVERELLPHRFSLALDCHSGFGVDDRLWFPYAHTSRPIEHLAELHALSRILDAGQAHHPYVFEPQSLQYLTHGDLWDHLYLRSREQAPERLFLPLTLEMGSWLWVKKNPRQLFTRHGIFNPLIDHRLHRVLRRHLGLLDFMGRAAMSHTHWLPSDLARDAERQAALNRWYGHRPELS
ncbi:M14 family zinc carboxypeptidase [Aquabacterium sp.]|uniref:M14 family zinc carboxypeptidase n=1 Tax=Aquabacterium sp. TaxID=1872578 RepID=UPI0025BACBB1|nr:M14 family zinc carboxypeptidase [Aquabacterium sp.]